MKCKRIFAAVLALSMTGAVCACAGKKPSAPLGSTEHTGSAARNETEPETTKEPQTSEETKDIRDCGNARERFRLYGLARFLVVNH